MSPFFFAWIAWVGIVILVQAVYVLKVGVNRLFLFPNVGIPRLSISRRFQLCFITLACSVLPLFMASRIVFHFRQGITLGDAVSAAALCLPGIWFMIDPTTPIKWAQVSHPGLPLEDKFLLWISRFVGAVLLFTGLLWKAPW
jgi:hypothetical protein